MPKCLVAEVSDNPTDNRIGDQEQQMTSNSPLRQNANPLSKAEQPLLFPAVAGKPRDAAVNFDRY